MLSHSHTTLMLPLASTPNCGLPESATSFERFCGIEKVKPASVEWLKKISKLPGASFTQTTSTPPWLSTEMRGLKDEPKLFDTFRGAENVAPLSFERLNRIFEFRPV